MGPDKHAFFSMLRIARFGLRIAGNPFLHGRARFRHLGVVADSSFLVDVGVDLLHRTSVGAVENLCRRRNGNPRVLGVHMLAQHLECLWRLCLEHLLHLGRQFWPAARIAACAWREAAVRYRTEHRYFPRSMPGVGVRWDPISMLFSQCFESLASGFRLPATHSSTVV